MTEHFITLALRLVATLLALGDVRIPPDLLVALGASATELGIVRPFSRARELEADARAGYEPTEAVAPGGACSSSRATAAHRLSSPPILPAPAASKSCSSSCPRSEPALDLAPSCRRMVSHQLAEVCYDRVMRRGCQGGIALISVLWITTLLAVIAASFTSSARTEGQLARNMVENAKAEALADGAVHRAVLGILETQPERAWRTDGRPYRLDYGGGSVVVRVFDEDSKVDLNAASAELLGGLFLLLGLDEEQAETLADRIVDFRDEDDQPEPNGAEDPDYEEAGRADGALDRPLVTEAELRGVLGMSEELYGRLRPFVTVYSGAEGIDPTRASPEVLRAVPGMTPELADAIREVGPDGDPFEVIDDEELFDLELYFVPSREIMFRVQAEARTPGGGVFVREAVIELSGQPARPFMVHVWRRGALS